MEAVMQAANPLGLAGNVEEQSRFQNITLGANMTTKRVAETGRDNKNLGIHEHHESAEAVWPARRGHGGDVTGKDHFAAARLDDQWMLVTPASSTLPTSLTLISPLIPLSTTPASPALLAPAPSESRGVRRRLGGLGFHETPSAGLGHNGGGARAGSLPVLGFSKAAMRSRSEPGLGFGGGGASQTWLKFKVPIKSQLRTPQRPALVN
ncbi:hypothetical protein B0H13DRAFT_1932577 [Mycena leptocephala]|nr:hypothetical protein B0H13DRAFT_1932577 [Mycena leptocephala]